MKNQILEEIYNDASQPGSLSGLENFYRVLKSNLADLQKISKFNDYNRYLVTCIDVFSKFAWVVPFKNKKSDTVLEAFKFIVNSSGRKPNFLQSDQGTEFLNSKFKEYLPEIDVGFYYVNSELKGFCYRAF
jgi:hypothetical protein